MSENKTIKGEYLDGRFYELAKKFVETYKTIGDAVVLPMYKPAGLLYYDPDLKVVVGEDNWENKIGTTDLDEVSSVPIVAKTMKIGNLYETEFPDDKILSTVYDTLVEMNSEKLMDVYSIFSIVNLPIVRYEVSFKDDIYHTSTKSDAEAWKEFAVDDDDDVTIKRLDNPSSTILLRFNRKKLW